MPALGRHEERKWATYRNQLFGTSCFFLSVFLLFSFARLFILCKRSILSDVTPGQTRGLSQLRGKI